MEKKIVFCCSCFIDQSFWFVNSFYHSWKFDQFVCLNGKVSEKLFIYERNFSIISNGNNVQYVNEIIVCCIDCFIFTLSYVSAEEKMVKILNEIDCMFVAYDYSGFDDTENYIGNEHILNATLTNKERSELYLKTKKKRSEIFVNRIEKKSCFTSSEKYIYCIFCRNCKRIFYKHFLEKLFKIKR